MDRYTDDPTDEQRWRLRNALYRTGRETALDLAPDGAPLAEPLDTGAAPRERARSALALLHALTLARTELDWLSAQAARAAGATRPDTDITYADLGAAAGITRQSARNRWPEAIQGVLPGRGAEEQASRIRR